MKKILVINASPKGRGSDTLKVTEAFLEGFQLADEEVDIEYAHLAELHINPCCACDTCLHTTCGICHFVDDMTPLVEKYSQADYVITNFPLHNGGMGSYLELFIERLQPLVNFSKDIETEGYISIKRSHTRATHEKFIFISTCGSTNINQVYEFIDKRLDHNFNKQATKLFFPSTKYPYAQDLIHGVSFFKAIQWAGQDIAKYGHITPDINKILDQFRESTAEITIMTPQLARQYFGVDDKQKKLNLVGLGKINQMLKTYNYAELKINDSILQIQFTDLNEMYQLYLSEKYFTITPKGKDDPDAFIETTYERWNDLTLGKTDLLTMIIKQELSFTGDSILLQSIDNGLLFKSSKKSEELSMFLSNGRNNEWITPQINSWYIPFLPLLICAVLISYFPLIALFLGLLSSVLILITKRVTDVSLIDKGSVLIFMGLFLSYGAAYLFYDINVTNLYAFILMNISLLFGYSLFTKVPLSAYIGYRHHFKTITNLESFKKKHQIITKWFTLIFMLMPTLGLLGLILNIKHFNIFLTLVFIVICILIYWFSLNYETRFHTLSNQDN